MNQKIKYSLVDFIFIAQAAALGFAAKPLVSGLVHLITAPLMIPGGAVAGGIYMMFLVIPAALIPNFGVASLTAFVQAIMVLATGIGSHGAMSLLSYTLPGIAVEAIMLISRLASKNKKAGLIPCFLSAIAANVTGTFVVNKVFFALPFVALMLTLFSAAFSGGLGGFVAYSLVSQLRKIRYFRR